MSEDVGCISELLCEVSPLLQNESFNSLFTASADFPYNGQAIGDGVNRNSAIIGGRKNIYFYKILCSMAVTAELPLVIYSSYLLRADCVGKLHLNKVKQKFV